MVYPNRTDAATFNAVAKLPQPLIMIVEDDVPIRNRLRMWLETQGFSVLEAFSAGIALELVAVHPALIIVDLDLPDTQGDDLLRMLRWRNDFIPIVALSNRTNERCIVQALNLGADAYLIKSFDMRELLARMRNLLRRQRTVVDGEQPLLRAGDLSVDLLRRLVKVGEKQVKLTRKEFELLRMFLQNAGKVLIHRFLLGELWDHPMSIDKLRVYVRRLRQKIEADPKRPQLLLTEARIGYRMLAPSFRETRLPDYYLRRDGALITRHFVHRATHRLSAGRAGGF